VWCVVCGVCGVCVCVHACIGEGIGASIHGLYLLICLKP